MTKRTNAKKGRTKRTAGVTAAPNNSTNLTRLRGDVPRREAVNQSTISVKVPRPTGLLQFRQNAPVINYGVIAGAASAPTIVFTLNSIGGSAALTALFDFYRIDAIRMTIRPNNNAIGMVDPTVTALLPLYWVIDYTDSGALPSSTVATEYDNCMIISPGESAERTFQPMYNLTVRSVAGTDYVNGIGQWLPTTSDDILHYGCKFYIPGGTAVQTFLQTWTVETAYFFSFRQVA